MIMEMLLRGFTVYPYRHKVWEAHRDLQYSIKDSVFNSIPVFQLNCKIACSVGKCVEFQEISFKIAKCSL